MVCKNIEEEDEYNAHRFPQKFYCNKYIVSIIQSNIHRRPYTYGT